MNCLEDEDGAVNVDELTAIHNAKMMGKVKVEKTSDDPSIPSERHTHEGILGSQECVGSRTGQSKQNVRFKDKYVPKYTKDTLRPKHGKMEGVIKKNGRYDTYASAVRASTYASAVKASAE